MTTRHCAPGRDLMVTGFGADGRHIRAAADMTFLQRLPETYLGRITAMLAISAPILLVTQLLVPVFSWRLLLILAVFLAIGSASSRRQLLLAYPAVFLSSGLMVGNLMQTGTVDAFYLAATSLAQAALAVVLACTKFSPANQNRAATTAWLEPGDGTQIPLDLVDYECADATHGVHTCAVASDQSVQLVGDYRLTHDGPPQQVVLLCARRSPGGAWYVPTSDTMLEPS